MKCNNCGKECSSSVCFQCYRTSSWSAVEPKDVTFGFDHALKLLKDGARVKRKHWGGYWFMNEEPQVFSSVEDGYIRSFKLNPTIFAVLKDNGGVSPATAYQEDLLAEDWTLL